MARNLVFVAASAALRLAPTRFARQSVLARHGAALRRRLDVAASAALRLAPTRFARQSVLARHGAARRRQHRPPQLEASSRNDTTVYVSRIKGKYGGCRYSRLSS